MPVPDPKTRSEIFKVHTKKMALAQDVNLGELVRITEDFTGADIAAVCKKAGRFAMRENINAKEVSQKHFLSATGETGPSVTPDIIDPALLRPGRFDEMILVPVPDPKTRSEIFKVHTKKMSLDEDVNQGELVRITEDFTGADIAAVCKKAGRFAMRENINAEKVSQKHFLAAVEETGPSVNSDIMGYYDRLKDELRKKRSKQIESNSGIYA